MLLRNGEVTGKMADQLKTTKILSEQEGDLQDGRGVRHGDHPTNTSICRTTPMEHLLNAGRRPQTSQKTPSGDLHAEVGPIQS